MSSRVEHIAGRTFHGRSDAAVVNAFSYSVDYLLLDPETPQQAPWLFRRNRPGLVALHDSDHGGPPGQGRGPAWVRKVLRSQGLAEASGRILLLAQPRVLGHVFNPVSFWLCHDRQGALRVVIAEVTNTYGDRHSYLCHHDDHRPIVPDETLHAAKVFHVSPFQKIEGSYAFRFDIRPDKIAIRITFCAGERQLVATLAGPRRSASWTGLLGAMLRRPFGSRRVLGLIHWQAFKLWWKGAQFHHRPAPPEQDVSR